MAEKGHWYTDKNGNHYFVKEGETPKEGWEASKRRKMIDGGKYKVDEGDGKGSREVSREEWDKYEADDDFDATTDDDFGFDEEEEEISDETESEIPHLDKVKEFLSNHPEYRVSQGGFTEFEYDDGSKVTTADIYKGDKIVARLEFDKNGKPVDEHSQVMSNIDFSEEVDVPYHEGAKGKIVDQKGDIATIEYTGENGITRRDQFHKDEIKRGSPDADPGEGLVDFRGKQKFLEKHGLDKSYYWDGADLVDAEDNSTTSVALPNAGIQEKDLLQQIKDLRKAPGDSGIDEKKLDHITDYFKAWGNPGEHEWDEVSKFYNLSPREGEELRKRLGMGSPDKMKTEFPDDKEKEPHYIGPDGNRYDGSSDYWQSKKEEEKEAAKAGYKPKKAFEDFEGARFYPVSDEDRKAAGPRWLGRYHSIDEAHGGDGRGWLNRDMYKHVGKSKNGSDIVQGPDGYYSGNPLTNSMSFKTLDAARDYLDQKNPDEHKYGVYFEGDMQRTYRGKDESGKEYDMEAPDAYKLSRGKAAEEKSIQDFLSANNIAPDSPIAKGLTPENRKFILELLKNRKK